MPREIDERKTKRALNRLRRAKAEAETRGSALSGWETEFVESVETRLKTYGSAFADPEKGDLSEPLSGRQRVKLREIGAKAKSKAKAALGEDAPAAFKPRKSLQTKKPMSRSKGFGAAKRAAPRVRDIADDIPEEERPRPSGPPRLRVIDGGSGG